ncbi:MAG: ABC transporter substrate-binding protein [Candidatus Eremiobacteraeota bacterium]|nr:ABC transporter substrate-binding protein [Candidatus Eremiobacteraeota bacterium]
MKRLSKFPGLLICLFMLIIFLSILSSCAPQKKIDPSKTKIEFWTISLQPAYNNYINGIISEFEEKHPDVVVEWVDIPMNAMKQKLLASIAGGVPPDVVNLNSEFAQVLAQNYAIVNMDSAVSKKDRELYFEGLWNAARFEGKNYAIPWYVTTRVVIYNREIFKKAGLDPDKPPSTWDEVGEYARIIKKKTGIYGYMPAIKFIEDLEIRGIPVVNEKRTKALFNSLEAVKLLRWYTNMYKDEIIPAETLTEGYQGAVNRYQSGTLAMIIAGPTLLKRIQKDSPGVYKKTWVAPMPMGKGNVIPAATMNLAVPISSKKRKLAVEFALFVTNDKHQLQFCKLVPLLPSTKKAAEDEFFNEDTGKPIQDEARKISIKQLFKARDLSLGLKHQSDLNRAIKEALESSFYGRKTPEEALNEAVKRWDEVLDRS